MNFSDFITHHGKRVSRDHFIHLIQVSKSDGKLLDVELKLLHKEGKKFGLTDPEIDKLIETEKEHHYNPPYSLADKFEHLYNVAVMILADEIVTDSEMKILRRFTIEAGFDDKAVDNLIDLLLKGIRKNDSEETLFEKFKKRIFGKS